eukprot:PhF_6_TR26078/c0_g1_i5/m.36813
MDAEGLPVDPVKNYPAKVRKYLLGKGVPPEAVASLADAAIAKYPKESIFASLDSEYTSSAPPASDHKDFTTRVKEFYAIHEPAKIGNVTKVLEMQARDHHTDDEMMSSLAEKYPMDAEGLPVDPVKNYPAKVRKYLLGKGVPPEAV